MATLEVVRELEAELKALDPNFQWSPYVEIDHDLYKAYCDEAVKSENFDIKTRYGGGLVGGINVTDPYRGGNPVINMCAADAILHYNDSRPPDEHLELVSFVKVNCQMMCGSMLYITLKAKEVKSGKVGVYQAQVCYGVGGLTTVHFLRPHPTANATPPKPVPRRRPKKRTSSRRSRRFY